MAADLNKAMDTASPGSTMLQETETKIVRLYSYTLVSVAVALLVGDVLDCGHDFLSLLPNSTGMATSTRPAATPMRMDSPIHPIGSILPMQRSSAEELQKP